MKKKKILISGLLAAALTMSLSGCGEKKSDRANAYNVPSQNTEESQHKKSPADSSTQWKHDLSELADLIGGSDDAVTTLLGEGTPGNDNTGNIMSREYEFELYGEKTAISVSYEKEMAAMVIISTEKNDFDAWSSKISDEFGATFEKVTSDSGESDSRELLWKLDNDIIVSLKNAFDTVSIEIFRSA